MDIMKDWYRINNTMHAYAHENWKSFDVLSFNSMIYLVYQIHILQFLLISWMHDWMFDRNTVVISTWICILVMLFRIKVMNKLFSESNVT